MHACPDAATYIAASSSFHFTSVVGGGGGLSIERLAGKSLVTGRLSGCAQRSFTLLLENNEALRTKESRDRDSAMKTDACSLYKEFTEQKRSHKTMVLISLSFRPRFC